ncbi:hypothetical protein KAR91_15380, partial [Candidatus Pacearchaeota archaeon]|nr:hypothetical protein [Candidatus Pacearchaeota archaeon]
TPVGDFDPEHEGLTKANWQLTVGAPATGVLDKHEPNRNRSSIKVPATPNGLFNRNWWFVNNLPWIDTLEFGGYPQNVKLGSYNRRTGEFEIRTIGGFSKQAPIGMFRKNLAKWPKFLRNAKRRTKGRRVSGGLVL